MPVIPEGIAYAYTHETTQATTGYFSCQPPASLTLPQALARLEATPFDDFLRQHCLRQLSRRSPEEIKNLADELYDRETDSFRRMGLAGLLLECSLLVPELAHCCDGFPEDALQRLTLSSSLIYLRAASRKDFGLMQAWSAHFADNIARHHMLPHWEELELELPYSEEELEVCREGLRARAGMLEREHARMQAEDLPRLERRPAQETYEQAVNALLENDVLAGQEMRHQASLSPIALLRSWKVDLAVDCGRMRHSLRGEATAYGRGLSLAAARASYAMEIVERASSYVSVARTGEHTFEVTNRRRPMPLIHASCAKLRSQGKDFLPLSSLPLETPFEDYVPLYWLEARDPEGKAVLVPAQAVFLFCNLDEQSLFLAGGSTGLASGNTEAEARLAALTEIVERDAEATTPFSREGCFVLKSRDERLQALLDDYAARGIQIQFQDITTELGVPVYRCFVMSRRGEVAQATGANLCGSRAALAALTEVPWPYPYGEPTGPALGGLPVRWLEDLPDYSLPSAEASCKLLEKTLCAQGRTPLYVDISRKDLDMPVVRALVPGLELTADFDRFSRPSLKCLFLLGVHQAGKSRIALLAFFFQPVQEALELGGRIGMTGPGGVVGAERRGGRQVGEGGDQLLFRQQGSDEAAAPQSHAQAVAGGHGSPVGMVEGDEVQAVGDVHMVPVGPFLPFGRGGGIMPGGGVMEQGAGGQVLGMAYQVVLLRVLGGADGQGGLVHELA